MRRAFSILLCKVLSVVFSILLETANNDMLTLLNEKPCTQLGPLQVTFNKINEFMISLSPKVIWSMILTLILFFSILLGTVLLCYYASGMYKTNVEEYIK